MSEESTIPVSDEHRHCPACGTRVAERATSCLMCGTILDAEVVLESDVEESAPPERARWPFWVAVGVAAVIILIVAGLLLRPLIFPAALPTPTAAPTRTPTAVMTSTPTSTPTITPTPTPLPPRAHQVQPGENLLAIAEQYATTVEAILNLNPGITPELLQVGQVLLIPPAIPTPFATVELEGTLPPSGIHIHVVAPGETLLSIAQRYGLTISLIRAANPEIPAGSDVVRVNQSLIIPLGTPMPTLSPTLNPSATPTPLAPYPAPALLSPMDGAVFGRPDAVIFLQWASVGILRPGESYELRVTRSGAEPVVIHTQATGYRLPETLFPPPGGASREFRWHVRVVRRAEGTNDYDQASEPEAVRSFWWLEELPTPTPVSTPSPAPTP